MIGFKKEKIVPISQKEAPVGTKALGFITKQADPRESKKQINQKIPPQASNRFFSFYPQNRGVSRKIEVPNASNKSFNEKNEQVQINGDQRINPYENPRERVKEFTTSDVHKNFLGNAEQTPYANPTGEIGGHNKYNFRASRVKHADRADKSNASEFVTNSVFNSSKSFASTEGKKNRRD